MNHEGSHPHKTEQGKFQQGQQLQSEPSLVSYNQDDSQSKRAMTWRENHKWLKDGPENGAFTDIN
jgi:hypothetical protein